VDYANKSELIAANRHEREIRRLFERFGWLQLSHCALQTKAVADTRGAGNATAGYNGYDPTDLISIESYSAGKNRRKRLTRYPQETVRLITSSCRLLIPFG